MNPFTHSTVAQPLADGPCARYSAAAPGRPRGRAAGRSAWLGIALGVLAGAALPTPAFALDVNAATQEQLREVRGIGPKTAQIIVEERDRSGRYESFSDLSDRVKGIGPKKAAALQASGLTIGASAPAAAAAATPARARTPQPPGGPPGAGQKGR